MYRDDTLVAHLMSRLEGRSQFRGMMGVIVHNDGTVALALDLKPAAGTLIAFRRTLGILRLEAQRTDAAAHGQRIINVMVTGHIQLQMGKVGFQFLNVKLVEAGTVLLDIHGAEAGFLLDAEREYRTINGIDHRQGVGVIQVEHHGTGQQCKLLERHLEAAHGAVIFQMIVINVEDHADVRGQMQEGLAVLTGFDDNAVAFARLAVAVDQGQLAADDRCGVLAGQFQHGDDHAGRRGLAVGACHTNAVRIQAADISQQHAALHRGNAAGVRFLQFGIVLMDSGAVHDQLCAENIGRIVAQHDLHPHGTLRLGDLGLFHITAGHGIPLCVQDLDERIHTGTAAANKMDVGHPFQQFGIVTVIIRHASSPQKRIGHTGPAPQ